MFFQDNSRFGRIVFFAGALLVAGLVLPLAAQETVAATSTFVIDRITYEIEGRTRQWALEDLLELEAGLAFPDENSLITFLARQQQKLINLRVLQDATVDYIVTSEVEKLTSVAVTVTVRDTWNRIVLPYFKYDSNTGLLLSLRARDYNFFGTTQALEIDFDYEKTEELEDVFTIASEFSLPFNMLDRRWELIMAESLAFEASDVDFELDLGLRYYFELLGLDWSATYTESYRYLTDDPENDNSYFTSRFDIGSTVETGVILPGYGGVNYLPEVFTDWSYRPGGISEERKGISVGFEHALQAGDYDWIGNYRRGQRVTLGNTNAYNIHKERWSRDIQFDSAWYRPLWQPSPEVWPKVGVSAGFSSFYLLDGADEDQDDAVEAARGILNDNMTGDLGLFLNLDAVITFWTLRPVFEAQIGTFLDVAYVRDLRGDFYDEPAFDSDRDLRFGSGIEVIGFPLFARSLYVRASLGFDLTAINAGLSPTDSEARELFFGLGHHY